MIENEFSRIINLELITKAGTNIEYVANDQECENLAKRFSIPKVVAVNADCQFRKLSQKDVGDYRLSVHMKAELIQRCVVTLDDINESIDEKFFIIFQNQTKGKNDADVPVAIDFDAREEDIEVINDKEIDVGEYIAEYLSLSMNLYPRQATATGSELGHKIIAEDEVSLEPETKNPFNVLKDLKHKT